MNFFFFGGGVPFSTHDTLNMEKPDLSLVSLDLGSMFLDLYIDQNLATYKSLGFKRYVCTLYLIF